MFSAERNCFPEADRAPHYPAAASPYRYLNAGTFIGEASYLLALLARWDVINCSATVNDQLVIADKYLSAPSALSLDHDCRLFQCLWHSEADLSSAPAASATI